MRRQGSGFTPGIASFTAGTVPLTGFEAAGIPAATGPVKPRPRRQH